MSVSVDLWPWVVVLTAAVVTYIPRAIGVALAGRIDPDGRVIRWVEAVAYALLAGLIARLILLPLGPLQDTPLSYRIGGAIVALAVYLATRRNLLLGVAAGVAALALLTGGDGLWG